MQHNISGRAHIISVLVQKPIILKCKCCCRYFFPTQPLGQFSLLLKPLKPLYPLLTFSLNISHQPINNSRLNSLGKKKSHWNTPTTERRNEKQFCFFFATNKTISLRVWEYHYHYDQFVSVFLASVFLYCTLLLSSSSIIITFHCVASFSVFLALYLFFSKLPSFSYFFVINIKFIIFLRIFAVVAVAVAAAVAESITTTTTAVHIFLFGVIISRIERVREKGYCCCCCCCLIDCPEIVPTETNFKFSGAHCGVVQCITYNAYFFIILSLSLFATPSHFFSTTCAHICLKNDVVVQFSSLPWPIVSTFSGYLNVNLVVTAERGKRKTSGEKSGNTKWSAVWK